MSYFDLIKSKVTKTARSAAKASGDAVDYARCKLSLMEVRDDIATNYKRIGQAVYECAEEGSAPELEKYFETVTALKAQETELLEKLAQMKKVRLCPECLKEISKDAEFCSYCGCSTEKE
ncbi:MAG: hypothetical protein E7409_04925 [Ruminococcaceae bacterium]|nr:hypothetical protein [Oscillospiraceae bacterium]